MSALPYGLAGSEARRLYMRLYMARRRSQRRPRGLKPRSAHCSNCGHLWEAGGRCPLCTVESRAAWRASRGFFRVRRWIAWAQLMEAIAETSTGPHPAEGYGTFPDADAVLSELSA